MKTFKLLSFLFIAILMAGCSSSKVVSEADIIKHNIAVRQIENRQFMVKADRLILDKRSYPSISPSTNFVLVNGDDATVQVSPGYGGGPNGVGGFTVKGTITGYEVKYKKNGDIAVKYNVMANPGSCSVFINIPKDGCRATVTINNTFHGKNATIYGLVSDIDNSIFVGKTRY